MRKIVVTGANRGIGFELVKQLVERGDRVIATARKPSQSNTLNRLAMAHPGRLTLLPLDVADPRSIAELAKEAAMVVESLDGLVNNAGVLVSGETFGHIESKALHDTFTTNVAGPVLLTQALAKLLEAGESARVLNISSTLGSIARTQRFGTPSYAISKAALNMATRQLGLELATRGITVAAVSPGWVQTDMGGAGAQVPVEESARDLIAFFDALSPEHAGGLFERTGEPIPF